MKLVCFRWLPLLLFFFNSNCLLFANTYYIKSSGNDNLDGLSIGNAWQSITKVNAIAFLPGDTVLFEGGSTFSGNIYINSGGTIKNPIVFGSYGSGKATILAGNGHGFFAYNVAGIKISHLIFSGSGYAVNTGTGVYFYMDLIKNKKLKYVVIDNVEAKGFKTAGIQISSWPLDSSRSGYDTVIVSNCLSHDNGLSGISMSGYYKVSDTFYSHKHTLISKCKVYNNLGISGQNTHSGSGIIIGQVDTCMMEYCEAYENGKNNNYSGGGPAGIWSWDSKNVIIQYCYAHHNRTQTLDGDGFDLDGGVRNSIMQYNYSHDNDGPGFLVAQYAGARKMKNITVRYNISERDGKGLGALIWSGDPGGTVTAERIDVYNNTIYTDTTGNGFVNAAIAVYNNYGAMKDIRICNNIFITKNNAALVDIQKTLNLSFYNNAYFDNGNGYKFIDKGTSYSSLVVWRSASGQEIYKGKNTGFRIDPLLINPGKGSNISGVDSLRTIKAYRYNNTSTLIGKAILIDSLLNFSNLLTDFYGDTIVSNNQYSPGAHEIDAPKAQFSVTNNCLGVASKFINVSLKSYSYLWNFGDGATSTFYIPKHQYGAAGTYTVTLIAQGKFGYIDSIKRTIKIYDIPSPAVSITNPACQNKLTTFVSASVAGVTYSWEFDDSTTDLGIQSKHHFKYPGIHYVKLTASNPYCKDSSLKISTVHTNPVAKFSWTNHCQGTSKTYNNLSTGNSLDFWDFGDSTLSNLKNPSHTYTYSGNKTVSLIVVSNDGCADTSAPVIEIYKRPKAFFITGNHCFGDTMPIQNVSFNDSTYSWNFGDGTTSNTKTPRIIAKQKGNLSVQLIVLSNKLCADTLVKPVTVFNLPDAQFTYTKFNDSFYFTAKDISLSNYQWTINNQPFTGSPYRITTTFDTVRFQKISLKTRNSNNCSDTFTLIVDSDLSNPHTAIPDHLVVVYPNPYQDNFTIQYNLGKGNLDGLYLMDLQGRVIYTLHPTNENTGMQTILFNSEHYPLAKGLYHLVFSIDGNLLVKKLVKN